MHAAVDPEPRSCASVRIEVVHEEHVQHVALKVIVNGLAKRIVVHDVDIGPRLLKKAEMSQVQIIPPPNLRAFNVD